MWIRLGEGVVSVGEKGNEYGVLLGKFEGNTPPSRPRHRWEDNIKLHLEDSGGEDMKWINLAQDRDYWRLW